MNKESRGCLTAIIWLVVVFLTAYIIGQNFYIESTFMPLVFCAIIATIISSIFNKYLRRKYEKEMDNFAKARYTSVNNNQPIEWNELLKDSLYLNQELKSIIRNGIHNHLLRYKGEFTTLAMPTDLRSELFSFINTTTLEEVDKMAINFGMKDYGVVDIKRSSNPKIKIGTYIYKFDNLNNLKLFEAPISFMYYSENQADANNSYYAIFNRDKISDPLNLMESEIKDFQYFGTQLMETNLSLNNKNLSVVKTLVSEFFLGPSYTILKGLSNLSLSSTHNVNDLRSVQVILNDRTDIEFSGFTIYYEFNRRFGNIKNKENNIEIKDNEDNTKNSGNYIDDLRELKKLFDEGIISKIEFEEMKGKILKTKFEI